MTTKVLTAHVPLPLAEKVDQLAARLERSRGWIIKQALSAWVEQEEERRRLTLEALADVDAGHVIDHQAVQTARANALANAVALTAALPDALTAVDYDVIVANILAQPLIELAPLFARLGARVALSGILETQAAEVRHAYAQRFDMHIADGDEGWVLLEGARK